MFSSYDPNECRTFHTYNLLSRKSSVGLFVNSLRETCNHFTFKCSKQVSVYNRPYSFSRVVKVTDKVLRPEINGSNLWLTLLFPSKCFNREDSVWSDDKNVEVRLIKVYLYAPKTTKT